MQGKSVSDSWSILTCQRSPLVSCSCPFIDLVMCAPSFSVFGHYTTWPSSEPQQLFESLPLTYVITTPRYGITSMLYRRAGGSPRLARAA